MDLPWVDSDDGTIFSMHVLDLEHVPPLLGGIPPELVERGDGSVPWSRNLGQRMEEQALHELVNHIDDYHAEEQLERGH